MFVCASMHVRASVHVCVHHCTYACVFVIYLLTYVRTCIGITIDTRGHVVPSSIYGIT